MPPNLNEEKKLWKRGFKIVAGIDEVGRGCLSGPVVAVAVVINPKFKTLNSKQYQNPKSKCSKGMFRILNFGHLDLFRVSDLGFGILKLRDSKKLSQKQREKFYRLITKNPAIEWGIGKVSERVIDKINILEATKLAMKRAVESLEKKIERSERAPERSNVFKKTRKEERLRQSLSIQKTSDRLFSVSIRNRRNRGRMREIVGNKEKKGEEEEKKVIDFLILDGKIELDVSRPQKAIIKADERVVSCALASIVAKVSRDRMMVRYHEIYPRYGFDCHKGYPTKYHLKKLKKYGPCVIHRKSFAPLKELC